MPFDRICRGNGIRAPAHRTAITTHDRKVERFHRTLKQELLDAAVFETVEEAQAAT